MASGSPGSGGVSLRSLIKDKIKHSAIGESVTGRINSFIKHEQPTEPGLHFSNASPTHIRSASMDSVSADKDAPTAASQKTPQSAKESTENDKRRLSFEVIESADDVKEAQKSDVYEQQLVLLQEQLVSSMIENQNMATELAAIKSDKQLQEMERDLAYEKKKNNELLVKISAMAQNALLRKSIDSTSEQTKTEHDGAPAANTSEVAVEAASPGLLDRLFYSILHRYYELIEDFSVTAADVEHSEVVEPLSVKILKDNVKRFRTGISPILDIMSGFRLLFNWHTPLLTGTVFVVYMYACWIGFLIPGLLFVLSLRLFLNFLEECKLISAVNLLPAKKKEKPEKERETSVSDKFGIVLDVATKVQNALGQMADGLEKVKNLMTWKRADDTRQIFLPLLAALMMTSFLKLDTIMFLMGSLMGLKLFIIDPVYRRFPKVKERYDNTHHLWNHLVTDAQLEKQTLLNTNNQRVLRKHQPNSKAGPPLSAASRHSSSSLLQMSDIMSEEDKAFCDRFHLPDEERPVSYSPFKGGRSCFRIDRDVAFKVTAAFQNQAKLYLTPSFLCYELVRQDERKAIPLSHITWIEKKKPISFLPGNGMSLEITEQGFDKPHLFGGLIHRDDCYSTLMDVGKMNGLQYAMSHEDLKTEIRLSELVDEDDIELSGEPSAPLINGD